MGQHHQKSLAVSLANHLPEPLPWGSMTHSSAPSHHSAFTLRPFKEVSTQKELVHWLFIWNNEAILLLVLKHGVCPCFMKTSYSLEEREEGCACAEAMENLLVLVNSNMNKGRGTTYPTWNRHSACLWYKPNNAILWNSLGVLYLQTWKSQNTQFSREVLTQTRRLRTVSFKGESCLHQEVGKFIFNAPS